MTELAPRSGRMRPRSRLGWWSVGLAALVVVVAPLVSLVSGLAIRLVIDASHVATTGDGIMASVPCVVISAALGIVAVFRGDRSPAVIVGTSVMTVITVFLWAEEFLRF